MRKVRSRLTLKIAVLAWLLPGDPFSPVLLSAEKESEVQQAVVNLTAQDKGRSKGVLFTSAGKAPAIVVISFHPNLDRSEHFTMVPLAKAGIAAFGMASRYLNNTTYTIQEELLLDIAAAVKYLREKAGFKHVVLLGHSGGASPAAFYQSQAETAAPARVKSTPAGDPLNLNDFDLPKPDAFILMAPTGELTRRLDPSVIDEDDLYSVDPSLDMYHPANGFKMPPEKSSYSQEFLKRYREAQEARMARLDQAARGYVNAEKEYEGWARRTELTQLPLAQQLFIKRRAIEGKLMVIHRTSADPKNLDLSLDPSDRAVGLSLSSAPYYDNPEMQNYSSRSTVIIAPRSFLSTRSAVSNQSRWEWTLPKIKTPTLLIQATADKSVFPSDIKMVFDALGTQQKKLVEIEGAEHVFLPSGPKAGKGGQREQAVLAIESWAKERFSP